MDTVINALVTYYKEDPQAFDLPTGDAYARGSQLLLEIHEGAAESERINDDYSPGGRKVDSLELIPLLRNILEGMTEEEITILGSRLD